MTCSGRSFHTAAALYCSERLANSVLTRGRSRTFLLALVRLSLTSARGLNSVLRHTGAQGENMAWCTNIASLCLIMSSIDLQPIILGCPTGKYMSKLENICPVCPMSKMFEWSVQTCPKHDSFDLPFLHGVLWGKIESSLLLSQFSLHVTARRTRNSEFLVPSC